MSGDDIVGILIAALLLAYLLFALLAPGAQRDLSGAGLVAVAGLQRFLDRPQLVTFHG